MIWLVFWAVLVAWHLAAAAVLWKVTGLAHPDDRLIRRLCMICWLLFLLLMDGAVLASYQLVTLFARLVSG